MAKEIVVNLKATAKVENREQINELRRSLKKAQEDVDLYKSKWEETLNEISELQERLEGVKNVSGIKVLEQELETFRETAQRSQREFTTFLKSVNLNTMEFRSLDSVQEMIDNLGKGLITVNQAVAQVKSSFGYLMEDSYKNGSGAFNADIVKTFATTLDGLTKSMDVVLQKLSQFETDGVKAAGGSGGGGLGNIAETFKQIAVGAEALSERASGSLNAISELVSAINSYANVDSAKLLAVSNAFGNIAAIGGHNFSENSVKNIINLATELSALNRNGDFNFRFDLTGINGVTISKTIRYLTEYLPGLSNNTNFDNLAKISSISFANLSSENLKVSKATIANLMELIQTMSGTASKKDAFSQYDYGAGQVTQTVTQELQQASAAVRDTGSAIRDNLGSMPQQAKTAEAAITGYADKVEAEMQRISKAIEKSYNLDALTAKLKRGDLDIIRQALQTGVGGGDPFAALQSLAGSKTQLARTTDYIKTGLGNPVLMELENVREQYQTFIKYIDNDYSDLYNKFNALALLFKGFSGGKDNLQISGQDLYGKIDTSKIPFASFEDFQAALRGISANFPNLANYSSTLGLDTLNLKGVEDQSERIRAAAELAIAAKREEATAVAGVSEALAGGSQSASDHSRVMEQNVAATKAVVEASKEEKAAFSEGNQAKKEDAAAAEAAAKAEEEKRKISELLATALKREEEASLQNSAASEQDADRARRAAETYQELLRIQNEIGNRQVTLAGLNPERDAQQITALTNSIRTLQGQYDALFQQSGADLFEAQSNRLTRGFEQIALRVEEVRGRISDLSNSTAEADKLNVALTAVNNTLRSVESEQARMRKVTGGADTDYYHSLTELAEQLQGLRDSGGSAAALTSGLKELKLTYAETLEQANLFKIGVNEAEAAEASETRESSQHAAALEQLTKLYMQVEQARAKMAGVHSVMEVQEYESLAQRIREVQAADQAETMTAEQLKAVYAQLHQTFTEVNAAAQPLIQQSRDRAAAEKEEAASIKQKNAEDKKATAEEQKRASMVKTLNGIIRQCTDAEKKYAAVRNAPNLRQYFDEFKNGAAKAQELKDKLESGEPITRQLTSDFNDLRVSVDNATTSMQTKGSVFQNYITSGMEQLASRMKYSLGLAAVVYKAVGEVKKMVSTAVELDSAMNTLQIVTRASGAEMDEYGKRVSSMAKETAQATKDLIDATTVYARLGYSMDESAILSKYTAMLQSVGDIDASSAQNAITAIIKAFDKGVNDIEDVMDKMVLVGNGFPISVAQIAEGMNNAGSMLNVAGNSFEESIALLTAANSTIQNISKASTGLRTIAARIRKTTTGEDDEGEIVEEAKYQEMINALTRHHVDLIDKETNQYRSTYEIIKDIAAVWSELTSMEQAAIVEALAGTRQQNIFASLMTQFGTAEEAVERMKKSDGELQAAYDIRMESIQAHINTLKAAFDELSMKVVNSDLAKGFIDIVTKIVEGLTALVDKIGGVGVALSVLGGIAAVKFLTGGGIAGLVLDIAKLVTSLGSIAALLPELALFAGATLAVIGLVAGIKKLKQAYDEAHPSFDMAKKMLAETDKAVDDLNAKIDENNTRIRELEAAYKEGDFTVVQEAELTKLEAENALLEAQLELEKQIQEERQKKVHETAVETANTLLGNNAEKNPYAQTIQNVIDNYRQAQKDLEDAQNYYTERGDKATKTDKTYVDVAMYNLEQRGAELNNVLNQIAEVTAALDPEKDKDLIDALTKSVADFTKTIDGNSKKSKKWAADLKDLEKRYGSNLDALKRLARGEQVTREEGEKLRRWMLDCRYTAEDLAEMLSQMGVELTEEQSETAGTGGTYLDAQISKWGTMSDEIERAKKALEDYNNAMSGGNNGDTAAQMEEAWKKAVEDIDSGRIDSRAVWAFAEMAMSPQQIADLKFDATRIAQEIKSSFYQEMFKDEENDDGYSYGQRLLLQLEQNLDHLQGVNVWSDDTGLHYWIEDFAALANQLNVSEGFLDALLDDLDAYGSQLLTDTRQNTELVNTFLDIKDKATDAREAMKEFIAVSFANDKDMSDTTMARILQGLHEQGYLEIDPTEYLKVIGEVRQENAKLEEDNPVVTPELNDQPLVSGINTMMNNIQSWLNNNPLVVSVSGRYDLPNSTNSSGNNGDSFGSSKESKKKSTSGLAPYSFDSLGGKNASAGGKRSGTGGGNTLVNEDGPELISDDGRAFIANGGKPGFVYLTKDAIVFNADDTEEILRRGRFNGTLRALAKGTGHTTRSSLIGRLLSGRQYPAKRQVKGTQVGGSSTSYTKPSQHSTSTHVSTTTTTASSWVCPHCGRICGANASYCYGCGWPDHMQQELPQTTSDFYAQANGKIRVEYNGGQQYWYTPNNNTDYEAQYELQQQIAEAKRAEKAAKEALERARVKSIQDANLQKRVNAASAGGAGSGSGYSGSGGGNYVGGADYASASNPEKVDWVAVRINRLQRTIADLEKVASSGFKKLDLRLSKTKDQIAKTTEEIGVMNSAYNRYMQEANSVGLDSNIAGKVQNGTIDITEYDEETRKKIDEYTEW